MASLAESKKVLFRKQQLEWLKIGAIWGFILPGLAYLDFLYRDAIVYTVYMAACFLALKFTVKIRRYADKLKAEYQLMQQLEFLDREMMVFPQVKVETGKKEAQIDWVLVNKQGIWCVKVNNLSGKISGKEKDKNWAQNLRPKDPKSKEFTFPNPLLETGREAKCLKEYLRRKLKVSIPVYPLVVFTKATELSIASASQAVLLSALAEAFKGKKSDEVAPETLGQVSALLQA